MPGRWQRRRRCSAEESPLIDIHTVTETGSTNADLLAVALAGGAREGFWLRAERQTSGRGRQGRAWSSPTGNFYGSTFVLLQPHDPPAPTLGFVAAVALAEVVAALLPSPPTLKWPNDLLVDGAKLSGILLERLGDVVVVGIGVNLCHHPDLADRRTTSLAAQGVTVTAEQFATALSQALADWLDRWRRDGFAVVRSAWLARAHPPGTPLRVALPDGTIVAGDFDDLDVDGALLLCAHVGPDLATGGRRAIHAGDVFLV